MTMPPPNPDPQSGLPGIGYTAHDPVTGQPLGRPDAYGQQSPTGQPVYQPSGPAGYPGYPAQPGYPAVYPGYPQPGYGMVPMYGVPMVAPGPARPGGATAAAVLQFVQSAFVLIGGIYTIIAASLVQAISTATIRSGSYYYEDYSGLDRVLSSYKTAIIVVAVATVVAGGLLIAGGVTLLGRKTPITLVACLLSLGISVFWIVIITQLSSYASAFLWIPIVYAVLPIIALALALGSGVRGWSASR
jgi:hypothetical protein